MEAPMKTLARIIGTVVLLGLLTGCASRPFGIAQREWEALTPEQQAAHHQREFQEHQVVERELQAFSASLGSIKEKP